MASKKQRKRRKHQRLLAKVGRGNKNGQKLEGHMVMRKDAIDIYCFDDIDSYWGFSADDLINALKDVSSDTPINFYINSYGGEVFEGKSIYNFLKSWAGEVTTICTGIAASIASYLFLAGDKRKIYDNAMVMIHNPFFGHVAGDAEDLEQAAKLAKQAEEEFVNLYASVTGNDADVIRAWMKEETYFQGQEAVDKGFATELVETPEIVAANLDLRKLAAKLGKFIPQHKENEMDPKFKAWLEARIKPLGLSVDDLDDDKIKAMKVQYKEELEARRTPQDPPTDPPGDDPISRQNQLLAANEERVAGIQLYAQEHSDVQLNEDYLRDIGVRGKTMRALVSHAIKENWTIEKFELEARRAEAPSVGDAGPAIHSRTNEVNPRAMSAALCMQAIPQSTIHGRDGQQGGYEQWYSDAELEAASQYRDYSLLQVFHDQYMMVTGQRYRGRLNTPSFLNAAREALHQLRADGNTSWTALNIFDDLANKILWSAYENQKTTWQEWVAATSVSDFKTHNMYRLSMTGGYKRVGADGELQHGGFTDSKYTISAETFGKIVGLSRTDLINDDLGALTGVMTALGQEGAKFIEEMCYLYFMNNLTTIFPVAGTYKNYISGASTALGVDGLSAGEKKFYDQVDDDNAPLLVDAELLLTGTTNSVLAGELYRQASLEVTQAAAPSKTRPNGNPHVGKWKPVISPYIDNTNLVQRSDFIGKSSVGSAIPNQSSTAWFLLPRPNAASGSIIAAAFLNGTQRPTVEQGDPNFDVLGLLWRAYHDAGVGSGDPKLGVMSKGAA